MLSDRALLRRREKIQVLSSAFIVVAHCRLLRSNEYHLHRMDVVHRLSPIVSLLAPLEQLGASWGYEHVPYPYQCCDDEGKRFQVRSNCACCWGVDGAIGPLRERT